MPLTPMRAGGAPKRAGGAQTAHLALARRGFLCITCANRPFLRATGHFDGHWPLPQFGRALFQLTAIFCENSEGHNLIVFATDHYTRRGWATRAGLWNKVGFRPRGLGSSGSAAS